MKRYFWSGNTPTINGRNQQRCGVVEVEDDVKPGDLVDQICKDMCEESNARSFVLVAFNLVE